MPQLGRLGHCGTLGGSMGVETWVAKTPQNGCFRADTGPAESLSFFPKKKSLPKDSQGLGMDL
jgi:hypothetical protein